MEEYCKNCGAQIKENSKFCHECGSPIEWPDEPNVQSEELEEEAKDSRFCENCGSELTSSDDFCSECGHSLKKTGPLATKSNKNNNMKIIIGLVAVVAVLLVIGTLFMSGIFTPEDSEIKLETYDFGTFTMLVPEGSEYHEYDSIGKGTDYWAIGYENTAEENMDLFLVWFSNYEPNNNVAYQFEESDGDLEIYDASYGAHMIHRTVDGYCFQITGTADINTLKEISNSIEVKNPKTTQVN